MATPSFYYYGVGKQITFNGNVILDAYGADLSPQHPSTSGTWNGLQATGERNFDCSGFQVGNSVVAYTFTYVSWEVAGDVVFKMYLTDTNGHLLDYERTINAPGLIANGYARWYTELSIIPSAIRPTTSDYRLFFQATHSAGYVDTQYLEFHVTNMYMDTSTYTPGMMTVDGTNLVYTDYGGYKHKIQYDSNYSGSNVGTSNAGKIWVQDSVIRRLYYVDENGYIRRTYEADNRYGSTSGQGAYAGTQYKGALWTGSSGASGSSGRYLCFVNDDGYKMRLMNGNPANF